MVSVENLVVSALFLILAQAAARIGMPRRAFSVSESFIVGHWPFLYLNLVILHYTGGFDWTSLHRFDPSTLVAAQMVVALGILGFLGGGVFATGLRLSRIAPASFGAPSPTALRVGAVLTIVGTAAVVPNAIAMKTVGPEARSTLLLVLAHLLVPGVLLCFQAVFARELRAGARAVGGLFFLAGLLPLSLNWSRRPMLVVVAGALLLVFVLRRGRVDRRLFAAAAPVLALTAVAAFFWRNAFAFGAGMPEMWTLRQALEQYAGFLWLESSAFSALMVVVEANGLFDLSGTGSLLLPLIFWIPRSVFPAKPEGFAVSEIVGTDAYNIGPSLYGEVLGNVTILGLVPFMLLLGILLKSLDLAAARRRLSGPAAVLYLIVLLDMLFLVRGSFHTMLTPALLHFFVPLALFKVDRGLVNGIGGTLELPGRLLKKRVPE